LIAPSQWYNRNWEPIIFLCFESCLISSYDNLIIHLPNSSRLWQSGPCICNYYKPRTMLAWMSNDIGTAMQASVWNFGQQQTKIHISQTHCPNILKFWKHVHIWAVYNFFYYGFPRIPWLRSSNTRLNSYSPNLDIQKLRPNNI
jgi:hypothetical protein